MAVAAAGSIAGSAVGKALEGKKEGINPNSYANKANQVIEDALQQALPYYNYFAEQAKRQQLQMMRQGMNYANRMDKIKVANFQEAQKKALAYLNPGLRTGLAALDTLGSLYGIPAPTNGSYQGVQGQLAQALAERNAPGMPSMFTNLPLARGMGNWGSAPPSIKLSGQIPIRKDGFGAFS